MSNKKDKTDKPKVILLVGEGHSGSTLLDLIMDSHPNIVGVGELSHYPKHREQDVSCSCGVRIKECPFWSDVFDGVDYSSIGRVYKKRRSYLFDTDGFFYNHNGIEKRVDTRSYARTMEKVFTNILKHSGKDVVFDSSKSPERAELLVRHCTKFDFILVHLVRDGRAVAFSHIRLGRSGLPFMKKWLTTNLKAELLKMRNRGIPQITVFYEDVVNDPQFVISNILTLVGLSFSAPMLSFRNFAHHQAGGNLKLRLQTRNTVSHIKEDEEWKIKMKARDKTVFNLLFGWLNIFYKLNRRFINKELKNAKTKNKN